MPPPRHAWALGAGQHPLLLAGSRRGQAAALWVAEMLLQWQDLPLGLILTRQSSANAAPGLEPAKPGVEFHLSPQRGMLRDLDVRRQQLSSAQTLL